MLGFIYYCNIADVSGDLVALRLLGRDVQVIYVRIRSSVKTRRCYIVKYQEGKCRIYIKRSGKGTVALEFLILNTIDIVDI